MSRTKNRARKGPEAQPLREASKEAKRKQQEAKKAKRDKKSHQQPSDSLQTSPTQNQDDSITGPSTTSLPTPTASSSNMSLTIKPFTDLATTHNVAFISIISSTSIGKKVTTTLTHLSTFPAVPPAKEAVVMLHSKAKLASKLITVVEIAKREIAAGGGKWFQYNVVDTIMEKKEKKVSGERKDDGEGEDGEGEEEEEEGFETMKTPFERAIEGKAKLRAVPTMTTYLSRVRIEGLRKAYGEQTNGVGASN